jgi:UPF0176 protein
MQLYNKLSAQERKQLLLDAGEKRLTLSFYQYAKIGNPQIFRNNLFLAWNEFDILGRTNVANEGINAQISVAAASFDLFKTHLDTIPFLKDIRLNIAVEQDNMSFLKLKIKVRKKIVADGLNDDTFDVTDIGTHLNAEEFNSKIDSPNTILVDMRNHYESEIGHFTGAITPDVDTFRDSLPVIEDDLKEYKESKDLVMYCTGGIRCEKASAYFKHKGFKNVYQLEGGIIEYTRQVKNQELDNKFIGKNFVFDERRSERISDDIISCCHQCGEPADTHENCLNEACHLLFIQCANCNTITEGCCSKECAEINRLPEDVKKELRRGNESANKIFKKGRSEGLKKQI